MSGTRCSRSCRRRTARRSRTRSARRRRPSSTHAGHGPLSTVSPTVNGAAIVGQQISAQAGIWQGVGSIAFAFSWYRCDPTGSQLQGDSRRHSERLHAGRQGRRPDDRRSTLTAADSIGKATAYASLIGPVAAAGATLTPITAADDLRHRARRRRSSTSIRASGRRSRAATPTRGCAATRTDVSAR